MKIPKETKRLCPYCKKHTEQKVAQSKDKGFNKATTNSRGSKSRMKLRQAGKGVGTGNSGKTSRPPIKKRKMSGAKMSKLTDLRYECKECKKKTTQASGIRAKKIEFV